jgi:hypothetical protein
MKKFENNDLLIDKKDLPKRTNKIKIKININ